ncbi:MAG: hypothetical protein U0414_20375 [Polyangiaceae bacterium]
MHEAHGVDWDPLDTAVDDECRDLEATLIDLTSPGGEADPPPDCPDAARLRRAASSLMLAFAKATKPDRAAFAAAVITATKVMRIATYLMLGATNADVWRVDAVPNLLLLERAKTDIRSAVKGRRDKASRRASLALDVLDEILDPLIQQIGAEPRNALRLLTEGGRAPSPFCPTGVATPVASLLH